MDTFDQNLEIARLQIEISKRLGLPAERLLFDYQADNQTVGLKLITINPKHQESFLYHSTKASNKVEVLGKMLEFVEKNYRKLQTYTVQWASKTDDMLHTSYFRALDMREVLKKFDHGKNPGDYTLFSISLNPLS